MNEGVDGAGIGGQIHHLALAADWDPLALEYRGSTLGRTLEEEGLSPSPDGIARAWRSTGGPANAARRHRRREDFRTIRKSIGLR